jgi:hypothetical protein
MRKPTKHTAPHLLLRAPTRAIAALLLCLCLCQAGSTRAQAAPRTAAQQLPRFKGKSRADIEMIMSRRTGWQQSKRTPTRTEYVHSDGSYVRIDAYGNIVAKAAEPYTANNAHVHKQSSASKKAVLYDDRGNPTMNKDRSHIGIRNPCDLPAVRGRPHGQGTPKPHGGRATGAHHGH